MWEHYYYKYCQHKCQVLCKYLPQEFPVWGTIKGYCVASRRVASRRVASRRVASRRVASRRVASRRVASRRVASRRVASRRVALQSARNQLVTVIGLVILQPPNKTPPRSVDDFGGMSTTPRPQTKIPLLLPRDRNGT